MTDDGVFDEDVAKTYDQDHGGTGSKHVEDTVNFLADLAGTGTVLEFAIGTGRIALPLKKKCQAVKGIELSQAMVDQLRLKETDAPIEVYVGDMTTTQVPGSFSLVFLVFNTIDNLTTQQQQVACFKNAARHLSDGGRFVVETQVPPLQHLPYGETQRAFACDETHFGIDEFNIATQEYASNHVWMDAGKHKHLRVPFRYVWPSELDLMAKLSGMELEERWADWDKSSFDNLSKKHVSVWKKTS